MQNLSDPVSERLDQIIGDAERYLLYRTPDSLPAIATCGMSDSKHGWV
ncbi:hypothetical protein NMYAN_120094 [Nitrosomonas nitrosa]|uniref:Uncharacterized protein n=1 Tax=Nitrosomonas nitrosa TaxID=52442 RepID=A0A8H9D843_9PROT|nr:hypothetical protein NMYAN_120094 [Nitrosomonas nitrosa]